MTRLVKSIGGRIETCGTVAASSRGTSVTSGAANTKGAYAQLIASSAFDADALLVIAAHEAVGFLGITVSALLDIAIGAAASEQVVIPDVLLSLNQWCGRSGSPFLVPCKIPAGSRIAARLASSDASTPFNVTVCAINYGLFAMPGGKIVSYGTASATSRGTSLDPGATANTKGAYSQLVASTNEDLSGIIICVGSQNLDKTTSCEALLDIAIGAAASEIILIADLPLGVDTNAQQYMPLVFPFIPCKIPAGTRIAARCQNTTNTAAHRSFDVSILGVSA